MAAGGADLKATFKKFATKGGGTEATSKDITKWFKDAGVLGKNNSSNNLDIAISKCKTKGKPNLHCDQIAALVKEVAPKYGMDHKISDKAEAEQKLTEKLVAANKDLASGTTKQSKSGGVDRMTDASKYTGAHKERFDDSGKGKGIEGREDRADNSGYVGNYKGEGTYDSKTKK